MLVNLIFSITLLYVPAFAMYRNRGSLQFDIEPEVDENIIPSADSTFVNRVYSESDKRINQDSPFKPLASIPRTISSKSITSPRYGHSSSFRKSSRSSARYSSNLSRTSLNGFSPEENSLFLMLPEEMKKKILSHSDSKQRAQLASVCRDLQDSRHAYSLEKSQLRDYLVNQIACNGTYTNLPPFTDRDVWISVHFDNFDVLIDSANHGNLAAFKFFISLQKLHRVDKSEVVLDKSFVSVFMNQNVEFIHYMLFEMPRLLNTIMLSHFRRVKLGLLEVNVDSLMFFLSIMTLDEGERATRKYSVKFYPTIPQKSIEYIKNPADKEAGVFRVDLTKQFEWAVIDYIHDQFHLVHLPNVFKNIPKRITDLDEWNQITWDTNDVLKESSTMGAMDVFDYFYSHVKSTVSTVFLGECLSIATKSLKFISKEWDDHDKHHIEMIMNKMIKYLAKLIHQHPE